MSSPKSIRNHWREYALTPDRRVVNAKRVARVPLGKDAYDPAALTWSAAEGPHAIPNDGVHGLLVDFGQKVAGQMMFDGEFPPGAALHIASGPVFDLIKFRETIRLDSRCGVHTDPKFRALRLAVLSAEPGTSVALTPRLEFTGYPGELKGYFHSADDQLNRIWHAGVYTVQLCTQPHELSGCYNDRLDGKYGDFPQHWRSPYGRYVIWDGPRRDREVWIGDMWPESLTLLYSFGAPEVMRSSLAVVAGRQREDGLVPGSGITLQPFAEYACWWAALLERYHLLTGDGAFVRDMEPALRRLMDWLAASLDRNQGFLHIDHRQTWAWTLQRRGVVTGSQCVAFAALRAGGRLMAMLGDASLSATLAQRAEALRALIRERLWDAGRGCFKDSLAPPDGVARLSCDSNALAVLMEVATEGQADGALRTLREDLWGPFGTRTILPTEPEEGINWGHNHNVWPFVVGLELEARFEHGDFAGAMALLRHCWGNMADRGAETFWEMVDGRTGAFVTHRPVAESQPGWDTWDSYSHGWSAGVSYMLQAFVLGIRPTQPGFRQFVVEPRPGDLAFVEGAVPTPHGVIKLRWDGDEQTGRGVLEVPVGTTALVRLAGKEARVLGPGTHEIC